MLGELACVAALALGIDVGWQPLSEGGVEYLIQIEPDLLDSLRPGEAIGSDVPPRLVGQIRAYRITVGTEELPRELPPEPQIEVEVESPAPPGTADPPGMAAPPGTAGSPSIATPLGMATPSAPAENGAERPGLPPFSPFPEGAPSQGIAPPGFATPQPEQPLPEASPDSGNADTPGMPPDGPVTPAPGAADEPGGAGLDPRSWPGTPAPNLLPEVSARKPMKAEQAVFQVPSDDARPPAAEHDQQEDAPAGEKPKPWTALVVTLLGLFASVGANVYLGWMALDFRSRYQGLVSRASENMAGK